MTGLHEPTERPVIARRSSVRIVKPRALPRAARISLFAAVAASCVALALWRWWRPETVESVYRRSVADVELTWRCEDGHTFTAAGQVDGRVCAMCDKPAFAITTYECKLHGPYDVSVRFAANPDGSTRLAQVRVHGGDWFPATADLPCPKCGQPLMRKAPDALPRAKKPKP